MRAVPLATAAGLGELRASLRVGKQRLCLVVERRRRASGSRRVLDAGRVSKTAGDQHDS